MAVRVSNDPEGLQATDGEPALFPKLPSGRRDGRLARLDLASGEFPEPPQETPGGAALDPPAPSPVDQGDHGGADMGPGSAGGSAGQRPRVLELSIGTAGERHGAVAAMGSVRPADRLAELHHGFVELPGGCVVPNGVERPFETGAHFRPTHVVRLAGPPGRDPESVRLEGDHREIKGDRRDRAGDVRPDPRELLELGHRARHFAASLGRQLAGRGVQVAGPGVVARSLPNLEDPVERAGGQLGEGRELGHEPLEVRHRLGDPGLLQEDLGDPDAVRFAVPAPRKCPTVAAIPSEEGLRDRVGGSQDLGGTGARRHGRPLPDEAQA